MPVGIITINNQAYMLFKILPFKIISNKYNTNLKKNVGIMISLPI